MQRIPASLALLAALSTSAALTTLGPRLAHAQQAPAPPTAEDLYQAAWYRETAEGAFADALAIYRKLAADDSTPDAVRAKALFRQGVCLDKLGRTEEARSVFEQVLARFPADTDAAGAAKRELGRETDEQAKLRATIEARIAQIENGEAPETSGSAEQALREIGPVAAPQILRAAERPRSGNAMRSFSALLVGYAEENPALVGEVVKLLQGRNRLPRDKIAAAIGNSRAATWIEPLRELLLDSNVAVRRAALSAVGSRRDPGAAEVFRRAMADPEASVRVAALQGLVELDVQGLEAVAVAALGDAAADVRLVAIRAIGSHAVASRGAVLALAERLTDPDMRVVEQTLARLVDGRIGWSNDHAFPDGEAGDRVVVHLGALTHKAVSPLKLVWLLRASRRPAALAPLLHLAKTGPERAGKQAIEAIGELADDRAVDPLIDLLQTTGSRLIRNAVAPALLKTGTPRALEGLASHLGLISSVGWVLDALVKSGRADLQAKALTAFDALDADGRRRLLDLVGQNPRLAGAVQTVAKGLADRSPKVVRSALLAANNCWDPTLMALTTDTLLSTDKAVRENALRLLVRRADSAAALAVVPLLADANAWIADRAADVLTERSGPAAIGPVLEAIDRMPHVGPAFGFLESVVREEDAERLAALLSQEGRSDLRARVIKLLAHTGAASARKAIEQHLGDEDAAVRRAAVEALASLAGVEAIPSFREALGDSATRLTAINALLRLSDTRTVPALLEALDGQALSREEIRPILSALARLRDPRAVPAIVNDATGKLRFATKKHASALWVLPYLPAEPAVAGLEEVLASSDEIDVVKAEAITALGTINHPKVAVLLIAGTKAGSFSIRREATAALGRVIDAAVLPRLVELLTDGDAEVRAAAQASIDHIRYVIEQRRFAREAVAPPAVPRTLHLRPLRHASASALAELLQGMGLDASVAADARTNALLIHASPDVYEEIERAIEGLDRE